VFGEGELAERRGIGAEMMFLRLGDIRGEVGRGIVVGREVGK